MRLTKEQKARLDTLANQFLQDMYEKYHRKEAIAPDKQKYAEESKDTTLDASVNILRKIIMAQFSSLEEGRRRPAPGNLNEYLYQNMNACVRDPILHEVEFEQRAQTLDMLASLEKRVASLEKLIPYAQTEKQKTRTNPSPSFFGLEAN